jgi:diguanylate cyclase (GGDEF)-like protein
LGRALGSLEFALFLLVVIATLVLGRLNAFEWFYAVTRAHEEWQLDEVANFFFLATFVLSVLLAVRVRSLAREMHRRARAEAEATILTRHDPLTGVANRRLFVEELEHCMTGRGGPQVGSVLLIDLIGFNAVNDIHGHVVGDELLIAVSTRLSGLARRDDILARLGGDEFGLLLRDADRDTALRLANRIIAAVDEPFHVGNVDIEIGASVGISLCPGDGTDARSLVSRAGLAMYRAKAARESAYAFFDAAVDNAARERRLLEHDLRLAIDAGEIVPFYQPLVDLRTNRVFGLEVLARWQHPKRGLLAPETFIPIAEDTRMIGELSLRLLQTALKDASEWSSSLRLSVNIAPDQFRDPMLAEKILGALLAAGVSPDRLEVELTETALISDYEAARAILLRLKDAGVLIALDDFGKGYSSLSYLRELPFDVVKIDQSFVSTRVANLESAKIVAAVIGLSEALGLETLAEGVESRADAEWLREQGCHAGQGYLYSQPVPASEVPALLGRMAEAA